MDSKAFATWWQQNLGTFVCCIIPLVSGEIPCWSVKYPQCCWLRFATLSLNQSLIQPSCLSSHDFVVNQWISILYWLVAQVTFSEPFNPYCGWILTYLSKAPLWTSWISLWLVPIFFGGCEAHFLFWIRLTKLQNCMNQFWTHATLAGHLHVWLDRTLFFSVARPLLLLEFLPLVVYIDPHKSKTCQHPHVCSLIQMGVCVCAKMKYTTKIDISKG